MRHDGLRMMLCGKKNAKKQGGEGGTKTTTTPRRSFQLSGKGYTLIALRKSSSDFGFAPREGKEGIRRKKKRIAMHASERGGREVSFSSLSFFPFQVLFPLQERRGGSSCSSRLLSLPASLPFPYLVAIGAQVGGLW